MKKSDFEYELPDDRIAQFPEKRGESKLMILDRSTGNIRHKKFYEIESLLRPGDCVVINNSEVIPARFFGYRKSTGGSLEILLVEEVGNGKWKTLVNPGKKARKGDVLVVGDKFECTVIEIDRVTGERVLDFDDAENLLEKGVIPLPPYIKRSEREVDKEYYQTVYAKNKGSVAAPTAGLHFSEEIIKKLREKGIEIAEVTLHVGPGTFRPVKTERIEYHVMESERYEINKENTGIINRAKNKGGRIMAVGTTTVRVLETVADEEGNIKEKKGRTDLFIYPPYNFKVVDLLLTNFHLPGSTLIMLVSAFAGRKKILEAYRKAISASYRFYSYGDAMFIH